MRSMNKAMITVNFESLDDLFNFAAALAPGPVVSNKLDQVLSRIDQLSISEGKIMAAMDDLEAKLTVAETRADVATALLSTIHQELLDQIATGATPARIKAMADRLEADAAKYTAAADANPDPNAPPAPSSGP
jgi:hypothetical protein